MVQSKHLVKQRHVRRVAFSAALLCTVFPAAAQQVQIHVISAKTVHPVTDEKLAVVIGSAPAVLMPTNGNGIVTVTPGKASTIRITTNIYGDCRPAAEAVTDYSVANILATGITTQNSCSGDTLPAHPGEILLFETAKEDTPASSAPVPVSQLHIRIFNAKTNKPITDERLNVALRADQVGSVPMATDRTGVIPIHPGSATTIRILANVYADCRPRGELYTNYSIATILQTGIATGNLCSNISLPPRPGELLLFEMPKTYIPGYPNGPATAFPHSDEPAISH